MHAIAHFGPQVQRNMPLIYLSFFTMLAAVWCTHCWVAAGQFSDPANAAGSAQNIATKTSNGYNIVSSAALGYVQYVQAGKAYRVPE
jgi:hypothetical protein